MCTNRITTRRVISSYQTSTLFCLSYMCLPVLPILSNYLAYPAYRKPMVYGISKLYYVRLSRCGYGVGWQERIRHEHKHQKDEDHENKQWKEKNSKDQQT